MAFFAKPKYSTVAPPKKKDIPKDIYYPSCDPNTGEMLYQRELQKNWMVTPSGHHFPLSAKGYMELLLDSDSLKELDAGLAPTDALGFSKHVNYSDKLLRDQKKTGLKDAIISGMGTMEGIEVSLAAMEFSFIGGSMGSVVGEKITRSIEVATERQIPAIVISSSGGARMYEGILSLMQMAKTSAAVARHRDAGQLFISVLTDPTYGGVTASYAVLGDLNLAEPGARIGFAGPRVIKEGTNEILPEGFQTSEFLLKRGLIDQIVSRLELRQRIITFLKALHVRKSEIKSKK